MAGLPDNVRARPRMWIGNESMAKLYGRWVVYTTERSKAEKCTVAHTTVSSNARTVRNIELNKDNLCVERD